MHSEPFPNRPVPEVTYSLPSILQRIRLPELFPAIQPLEVELGSGDGSFLVRLAGEHSGHNYIGIERLLGRLRKLDRKARRAGLTNLRAIRIESAYFLQYLLPLHSVSAIHVYFPDPWPKRKHRRHRLINESFVALAHQALETEGQVYLRTDDSDYFAQMLQVFASNLNFVPAEIPEQLASVLTDFEREFNARGIKTLRAAYQAV